MQPRILLAGLASLAVIVIAACAGQATSPPAAAEADAGPGIDAGVSDAGGTDRDAGARGDAGAAAELLGFADLPRTRATQGLSATWYERTTRTLWALQDTEPTVLPIEVSADLKGFTLKAPIPLTGRTELAWDGEGLVVLGGDFIAVTNETTPTIERFDGSGARKEVLTLPAHFAAQAAGNKGLESLALSPSGRFLFTANEGALTTDGELSSSTRGTTVRILRRDLASGVDEERAYRSEPRGPGTGGEMGVSELAAISDTTLLVLERGYQVGYGNTVRIFRVDLRGGEDVLATPALTAATPVLEKTLVLDLATLPAGSATSPQQQPNPLLDNYEALAIGPRLPDGRLVVFVTSDDNASATQVPRILVLALPLGGD